MKLEKIKKILENYNIDDVIKCQNMPHGFANRNYKLTTSKSNYLFRINVQQDLNSIKYEMRVLDELKKIDFPAAYPIVRKDGKYITEIDAENVIIYDFVKGEIPKTNVRIVKEIATASAKLNSLPNWQQFERKNAISIGNCFDLIRKFDSAKHKYPKIFEYFIEQTEFLEENIQSSVPRGLIHADIFPDNTIFNGDKLVAIIDFEDVCTDDLIFEIGMAINGFCFLNNKLNNIFLKVFISNYNKIRPISKIELDLLPIYIQWTAHGMVSWHLQRLMECKHNRQLARTIELMERVKGIREISKWELL